MTLLEDVLCPDNLGRMVDEGFVSAKPGGEWTLYNYTQRTQWERAWNRETLACRGLVVREDGVVQSRPFAKFFNASEHGANGLPPLPVESCEVFDKLDGSLIVVSGVEGEAHPLITSRGAFASEQAIAADTVWCDRYMDVRVPVGETWCFEFIAPWNRIVVDYGSVTDLHLLARIDNATGLDLPLPEWPGPIVRRHDARDFDAVMAMAEGLGGNEEGFVLRYDSGLRVKVKGAEYVRLHRLLTCLTSKGIWECLANGDGLGAVLENVPDEFYDWARSVEKQLLAKRREIVSQAHEVFGRVRSLPTRKDQAMAISDHPLRGIVFSLLDGRDVSDAVWRLCKPETASPFRSEAA